MVAPRCVLGSEVLLRNRGGRSGASHRGFRRDGLRAG
jgi:hypothetical protein